LKLDLGQSLMAAHNPRGFKAVQSALQWGPPRFAAAAKSHADSVYDGVIPLGRAGSQSIRHPNGQESVARQLKSGLSTRL
ncbi:MAG: hypothetical protein ACI9WU_005268, partial [Myxococcota bacterium]